MYPDTHADCRRWRLVRGAGPHVSVLADKARQGAAAVVYDRSESAGFTLLETAFVLAVIGALVMMSMASFAVSLSSTRRIVCLQKQQVLNKASAAYLHEHGSLPPNMDALRPYVTDLEAAIRDTVSPTTLLRLDPSTGHVTCPTHPAP